MILPRKAKPHDLNAILTLIEHARRAIAALGIDQWQDGYPEPEVIAADIEAGVGFVFEADGRIAAYMLPMLAPEPIYDALEGEWLCDGKYLTVHRMAIDDGYRGSGLSRQMLAFAEEMAAQNGCVSVRADTHAGNLPMRGLLKKCGYLQCGVVRYPVTDGDALRVAYEKPLRS